MSAAAVIESDEILRRLLVKIVEANGLGEGARIKFAAVTEAGDGYTGLKGAVEAIGANGDSLELFVKLAQKSDALRGQFYLEECYKREIYFYTVVHPAFVDFQERHDLPKPFGDELPRCYGTTSEKKSEALVLEDLSKLGYVLHNRRIPMNEEHLGFVFERYARFHAVSFAMNDQDPGAYQKLTAELGEFLGESLKMVGLDKPFLHYAREAKAMFASESAELRRAVENLPGDHLDFFFDIKKHVDEYSVVIHGDAWCNNMMFRYEGGSACPVHVKLLDWQATRVNSPVLDLAHIFYSTASKEAMANLRYYQDVYYNALSESLRQMGSDVGELYPRAVFEAHWKNLSRYGLFIALLLLRLMLSDGDEIRDMAESSEGDAAGLAAAFIYDIRDEESYGRRVKDIIRHFVENEFLW